MKLPLTIPAILIVFGLSCRCFAEDTAASKPVELQVLKNSIGVWDAEIEVWPQGPDSSSIKFKGVETNRPYGEYWIASDFDSEYDGQTMKIHTLIGYDLDKKKLVCTIVDHGPYAAKMTGTFEAKKKTVTWITHAKDVTGKPMVQKTFVEQKSPTERVLTYVVPGKKKDEFVTFMQIRFIKRK